MQIPVNNTVDPVEVPRLSRQCALILERLRIGTVTNHELAAIALKYTGRISDLRAAGYRIDVIERDRVSGLVRYSLVEKP
jgi:23S rRNA C2498 (ribose-2'-O)-methylase RlmM